MSMNELQKQTNANIQAKANLIWEIATHLVGLFKPHEYGKVILPLLKEDGIRISFIIPVVPITASGRYAKIVPTSF